MKHENPHFLAAAALALLLSSAAAAPVPASGSQAVEVGAVGWERDFEGALGKSRRSGRPVLVYNNRPGRDAEILERYGEPAWNYQVIRFLDGEGKDIIPRRDRVRTVHGVVRRMVEALERAGRDVPADLRALAEQDG